MGKLLVEQKLFSIRDRFYIKDERGENKYMGKGALLSIGKNCVIMDTNEVQLARIEQKIWSWLPTFRVYVGGEQIAKIKREFTFWRPQYHIDFGNIEVKGDVWGFNYTLESGGRVIGSVNKKLFKLRDTYEVEVFDDEFELIVLALVLSIDYVSFNNND